MRRQIILLGLVLGSLAEVESVGRPRPVPTSPKPTVFIIVVHHDECTECGDVEIESGEVKVPVALRERYLQAVVSSPRSGRGDYQERYSRLLARCNDMSWRVGNVKLASEKDFERLFLLPGKKPSNSYDISDNPWDFRRRYRVTVEVVGIKWSYLTVRVRKAVRLADRKDY